MTDVATTPTDPVEADAGVVTEVDATEVGEQAAEDDDEDDDEDVE